MQGSRGQSGPERWLDQGWNCHPISTIIIIIVAVVVVAAAAVNVIVITQEGLH